MIIRHANTEPQPPAKRGSKFSGTAIADGIMPAADGTVINNITFEPKARTFWHSHERGQLLHVDFGYGLICTSGEQPERLRAGDWVWVPPGELHWHGAGPDTVMSHTAISLGPTQWSDEVTDEEYASTPREAEGHRNDE